MLIQFLLRREKLYFTLGNSVSCNTLLQWTNLLSANRHVFNPPFPILLCLDVPFQCCFSSNVLLMPVITAFFFV